VKFRIKKDAAAVFNPAASLDVVGFGGKDVDPDNAAVAVVECTEGQDTRPDDPNDTVVKHIIKEQLAGHEHRYNLDNGKCIAYKHCAPEKSAFFLVCVETVIALFLHDGHPNHLHAGMVENIAFPAFRAFTFYECCESVHDCIKLLHKVPS
jgi:hypothetical protein